VEERRLGKSGLSVTLVGLGCNNFGGRIDLEATRAVVHKALDLGITLFDTADIYGEKGGEKGGSESDLGAVLGPRRKDVILATKFGKPMSPRDRGASRLYIMRAVEACLTRLKTDWIDLFQLHEPDPATPIEETIRALDDLVRQGKVRYIGASNFAAWQLVEAQWTARSAGTTPFVSSQEEYSLLDRGVEAEIIPALGATGMGLLPFFPLASGLLTGKYKPREPAPQGTRLAREPRMAKRFLTETNILRVERLSAFCAARGKSLLELAFSWLAAQPAVASVIAGATKPEQLEQNVRAIAWHLTPDELGEIDSITLAK
jgi:aryl-alcohol dehydrogenase-like predicted oxidoreductase